MMRRKFTVFYKNGDSSRKINHYYIFGSKFCKLWLNIYRRGSHFAQNLKCGQGIYMITIFSCGKVIFQSCLSVQGGPMWPLTAGHQMLAPMGVPLPMIHWTSLYRESSWTWILTVQGHLGPILEICSNFFTWGPLPCQCWHLVATEACTVGKRAVRILLESVLVWGKNTWKFEWC